MEGQEQQQEQQESQDQAHWTEGLSNADHKNNPTLKKYDSQEAANNGHLHLQESMGMEKFVWPKDENDTERMAALNEKLGIPTKPEGYNLEDVANPEGVQLFDKVGFQEMAHEAGARGSVAEKMWKSYTDGTKTGYEEAKAKFQANIDTASNELKQEWGEAYESKIQQGQAVIDTFAKSQEEKDFLTVALSQDPKGIKFLAGLGEQFKEASIGGFQENRNFTYSPSEAKAELAIIKANPDYQSDNEAIRAPLVDRANDLMKMAMGSK